MASVTRLGLDRKMDKSIDFGSPLPLDLKIDQTYKVYMKAPYKLMDKKMDQRHARAKEPNYIASLTMPMSGDGFDTI
jgi:hypothetical protein